MRLTGVRAVYAETVNTRMRDGNVVLPVCRHFVLITTQLFYSQLIVK